MRGFGKKVLAVCLAAVLLVTGIPLSGLDGLGEMFPKAEAAQYQQGDIITFGSYPQSQVTDSGTVVALNGMSKSWQSYGYYSGNGNFGSMQPGDWMQFCDVVYGGQKYRGVYFTKYRPYYTEYSNSSGHSYQDDNGYSINTVYWFRYEPLTWKVLNPDTGLVLCEKLIDAQAYSNTVYKTAAQGADKDYGLSYSYWNDSAHTKYCNDYVTSSIRAWLNDDFYHTAFTEAEKAKIGWSTLDNSAYPGYDEYDSASTTDKIFLMSYSEMRNPDYGFSTAPTANDAARRAYGTDYAKCQGLWVSSSYNGTSYWWLRSPGGYSSDACEVGHDGWVHSYCGTNDTSFGVRPAFCLTSSDSNYQHGDTITFGSYPQSQVTDSGTVAALNGMSKSWKSYGYYSGNSNYGSMQPGDWMQYCDVVYGGQKYRGVYFTKYRPYWTEDSSSSGNSYQDDNGYSINTVYWFRYEPLTWKVLNPDTGLVLCEKLIDSQAYQNLIYSGSGGYYNNPEKTVYANDYVTSSIRDWLNDDFYHTAFTEAEKAKIGWSTLDNSARPGYEQYDSASTTDKIFLMSYSEMLNPDYGFSTAPTANDAARRAYGTDYAKCQGLWVSSSYNGTSYWRLRSPGDYSIDACRVGDDGWVYNYGYTGSTSNGVRPAFQFNPQSGISESEKKPFSKNTYMADIWLDQKQENSAENNWLSWFLGDTVVSLSQTILTFGEADSVYQAAVKIWEGMDYVFAPETAVADGLYFKEKDRYMGMLFDLVSYVLNNQSFQQTLASQASELASGLKSAFSLPLTIDKQVYTMSNYTDLKKAAKTNQKTVSAWAGDAYKNASKKNGVFSSAGDVLKNVGLFLDACDTAEKFYSRMTAYIMASSLTEELWSALESIALHADSAELQSAVRYLTAMASQKNLAVMLAGSTIESEADIGRFLSDNLLGGLLDDIPIYGIWRKVCSAGKTFCNFTLNTQSIIDAYYLAKAAGELYAASKESALACASQYQTSGSETDAGVYLAAVQLHFAVSKVDMDSAAGFIKAGKRDGLVNASIHFGKGVLDWMGFPQQDTYDDFCANQESIVQVLNDQWNFLNVNWILDSNCLAADYPDIYPFYASQELAKNQYDPVLFGARLQKDGSVRLSYGLPVGYMDGAETIETIGGSAKIYSSDGADEDSTFWDCYLDFRRSGLTAIFPKEYSLRFYANPNGTKIYTNIARTSVSQSPLQTPSVEFCAVRDLAEQNQLNQDGLQIAIVDNTSSYYDTLQYEIYRKTGEGAYQKIATVNRANAISGFVTVFSDSSASASEKNIYRVRSKLALETGDILYSDLSNAFGFDKTQKNPVFRPRVTDMRLQSVRTWSVMARSVQNSGIQLTWDAVEGADGYRIYRMADWAQMYEFIADTDSTGYVDETVLPGSQYEYRILAYYNEDDAVVFHSQGAKDGVLYQKVVVGTEKNEMQIGEELTLDAFVYPQNVQLQWISDNPDVVSVSQNGKVKALSAGTAVIRAQTAQGLSDQVMLTVFGNSQPPTTVPPTTVPPTTVPGTVPPTDSPSAEPSATEPSLPATNPATSILLSDPTLPPAAVSLGDVNDDGKINSSDARQVLRAAAKLIALTDSQKLAADVNRDGKVNSSDARIILRIAAKLEKIENYW